MIRRGCGFVWILSTLLLVAVGCGKDNSTSTVTPTPTPVPTVDPNAISYNPVSVQRPINSITEFREEVRNGHFIVPISDHRSYLMDELKMTIERSEIDLWLFDLPYTQIDSQITGSYERKEAGSVLGHEEGTTHVQLITFLLWIIDHRSSSNAYIVMNSYYRNYVRFFHPDGVFYDISLGTPLITNPVMYYDGDNFGYQYRGYSWPGP